MFSYSSKASSSYKPVLTSTTHQGVESVVCRAYAHNVCSNDMALGDPILL